MMKHLIFAVVLLAGCQAAENADDMHEAMPAVPALSEYTPVAAEAWNTNWSAGNADAIGSTYALDATVYPPGGEPVVGREAITAFWAGALAFSTNGSIATGAAENDGMIGYETGTYITEDSTGAHVDHGKFIAVWKYVDGEWKIFRDTWNTNMAPAAGM